MEDMAEKLTKLLEDDKSVDMLKNFASAFSGSNGSPKQEQKNESPGLDLSKIMQLASSVQDDDRLRLMQALRPFVSEQKRESLDNISNIMRILQILSIFGTDFKLF